MEESNIYESTNFVIITQEEYKNLVLARMGIDMIGSTIGRYGADDKVVAAVCKQFGYEYKENRC